MQGLWTEQFGFLLSSNQHYHVQLTCIIPETADLPL